MGHANGRPEDNTDGACCWETRFESVVGPQIMIWKVALVGATRFEILRGPERDRVRLLYFPPKTPTLQ